MSDRKNDDLSAEEADASAEIIHPAKQEVFDPRELETLPLVPGGGRSVVFPWFEVFQAGNARRMVEAYTRLANAFAEGHQARANLNEALAQVKRSELDFELAADALENIDELKKIEREKRQLQLDEIRALRERAREEHARAKSAKERFQQKQKVRQKEDVHPSARKMAAHIAMLKAEKALDEVMKDFREEMINNARGEENLSVRDKKWIAEAEEFVLSEKLKIRTEIP